MQTVIVPPVMITDPAVFSNLPVIFKVPVFSIWRVPPVAVWRELPVAVPTFKVPEETLTNPLLSIENPEAAETQLRVAPFTQRPALPGIPGFEVS